jgi:hypothetical protein
MPDAPTVATELSLLAHVPPAVALESDVVAPVHTVVVPDMDDGVDGAVLTVNAVVANALPQLLVTVYDMVAEPLVSAVTCPVVALIVATAGAVLLQLPPAVAL